MSPKDIANKFKFGTQAHKKLYDAVYRRYRMSYDVMSRRYGQYAENEEQFAAYVPTKTVDEVRKQKKNINGTRDYVSIEIPYSYAVLMTAHTYYTSVFLSRTPIFQFSATTGDAQNAEPMVEALLAYQMQSGRNLPQLYSWLFDPGRYGIGVLGHYWDEEFVTMRQMVEEPTTFLGVPIPGLAPKKVMKAQKVSKYQGSRLYNIRPQDFFPDPRVSLVNFHRGEFCGRYCEIAWHEFYDGIRSGRYFNYEAARSAKESDGTSSGASGLRDVGSSNVITLPGAPITDTGLEQPATTLKCVELVVRLRPNEWGLDEGSDLEMWVVTWTNQGVVIGAVPLGEYHGEFPYDILVVEPEAYSVFSASMLERVKPLNDVMSWLINSHFYNVRSALNNQFIYDPEAVVTKDLENPQPGKLIRLKPAAYGRDVRTILAQLQVADVTRGNVVDMQTVAEFIQRTLGVNDNIMGMIDAGGRRTATEVRQSTSFGINRLKTVCEYFSSLGFSPLAQKMLQTSQQHYDRNMKLRMVGDQAQFAPEYIDVTPEGIAGFFDFVPVDGTLPVDRYAQANLWQQLMAQAAQIPPIAQSYDFTQIFAFVANLAGLKNASRFKLQPPGVIQQQLQAGNVVPLSQAQQDLGRPQQIQVPNMGATA